MQSFPVGARRRRRRHHRRRQWLRRYDFSLDDNAPHATWLLVAASLGHVASCGRHVQAELQ